MNETGFLPVPGREVAVVGLRRSGIAATRLLRKAGREVYASDSRSDAELEQVRTLLSGLGASVDLGGHDLTRIGASERCIVSPGLPLGSAVRTLGVPVVAEAALGLEALPGIPFVAVTGSKGKSTTTAMIGHLLATAGRHAVVAGNIGTPLCEVALAAVLPEVVALELSSAQLHDMQDLHPLAGVLVNLFPEHLDFYPSVEAYYDDKRRLFAAANPDSVWVSWADQPDSQAMVRGVPGRHLRFSLTGRADAWYDAVTGTLMLAGEPLLPAAELGMGRIMGRGNLANALAASLAAHAAGVSPGAIAEGLRSFHPLSHRLEPVRELDGVLWINDSKSTTVESTLMAVEAMARPFVLLLGGCHKGTPYTALGPALQGRCRAVVAYGADPVPPHLPKDKCAEAAKPRIRRDLREAGVPVVEGGDDFEQVLAQARELARPGDAVLLSPACSSFDMFTAAEARGEQFRDIVGRW